MSLSPRILTYRLRTQLGIDYLYCYFPFKQSILVSKVKACFVTESLVYTLKNMFESPLQPTESETPRVDPQNTYLLTSFLDDSEKVITPPMVTFRRRDPLGFLA